MKRIIVDIISKVPYKMTVVYLYFCYINLRDQSDYPI